jgi:pilus assembly protein TadC
MTQSRFFQLSLLFPFVLWCICLLVFSLAYREGADFILKNIFNACRVFVPYLIFAAVVWKLASEKPYRLLIPLASVVPIVWGFFFTLFYMLISYIFERSLDAWHVLCIMAFWATVVAYLAEIIPFLILTIFKDDFKSCEGKQIESTPLDQCL